MRRRGLLLIVAVLLALVPAGVAAQDADGEDDEILVHVNGSQVVSENEQPDVVIIVNGNIEVAGVVEEFLLVVNGDATVEGTVNGDIWIISGTLALEDGAVVNGDVIRGQDATVTVDSGATVTGEVREESWDFNLGDDLASTVGILYIVSWLGTTVLYVVGAVLFAGIGGRQLWSSAGYLTGRPGRSILSAILFWIIVWALILILFFTLFGIPLALLLIAITGGVAVLGYIVAGTRIGAMVLGRSPARDLADHPYLPALTGVLILQIISLITAGGWLIAIAADDWFDGGGVVGVLVGIASAAIGVILAVISILGTGALIYRAWLAWTSPEPVDDHGAVRR